MPLSKIPEGDKYTISKNIKKPNHQKKRVIHHLQAKPKANYDNMVKNVASCQISVIYKYMNM